MRSTGLVVAVVLALAAALAPNSAAARSSRRDTPLRQEAEFTVNGTHGFKVTFAVSRRAVAVIAGKEPAVVRYLVHGGRVEGDRFAGKLPGIGGVSVRFRQRGKTRRISIFCPHAPILSRPGTFVGRIRFRGEKGYTEVRTTHAAGTLAEIPQRGCGPSPPREQTRLLRTLKQKKSSLVQLEARSRNLAFLSLQLSGSEGLALSATFAIYSHKHDRMAIQNTVIQVLSAPSILITEDPEFPRTATVGPRRPFSGSAALELRGPRSSSWTGDLAVTLPGVGHVRLAGPRFRSQFCVGKRCAGSLPPNPGLHYVKRLPDR
jgi:hypothetical protein